MTRTARQELITIFEGFLVLILLAATAVGLYLFVVNFSMIPLWAYPAAATIAIVSYIAGRIFERVI